MTVMRSPSDEPPFTLADIKKAVPSHCFKRCALRSFSYLLRDVVAVSLLVYVSTWFENPVIPPFLRWTVLWPLYWFFCGAFATGIWVIAHECGHEAFAQSPVLNDAVGFVAHSILLVPYYSWSRYRTSIDTCKRDICHVGNTLIGAIIPIQPTFLVMKSVIVN